MIPSPSTLPSLSWKWTSWAWTGEFEVAVSQEYEIRPSLSGKLGVSRYLLSALVFREEGEQSQCLKSLFALLPPWPSFLGPTLSHPSLLMFVNSTCWDSGLGEVLSHGGHCHHILAFPCWVQFRSYVFLGKLEDKGSSKGRAKRLKKGRKVDMIKKCTIFMCENCSETY